MKKISIFLTTLFCFFQFCNVTFAEEGIAYKTLKETSAYKDGSYINDWKNEEEEVNDKNQDYVTHVLYRFPEYEHNGDDPNGLPIKKNVYSEGDRIPLLVIHGWQGDTISPSDLIKYEYSAEKYWGGKTPIKMRMERLAF